MEIIIEEVGHGRYTATVNGSLVCVSKTPMLSAARKLLALGVPPHTEIQMRRQGSAVVAMRSTVGEAAHWTVIEPEPHSPRFTKYRPMPDRKAFPA